MENWFSQVGVGTKHFGERYSEYPAQGHDQHFYYPYEPSHGHAASSKHGGGQKGNAAMSALTLLAFLFFLHILQQCLKDHMAAMSTPQVMVVSAGRGGERTMSQAAADNDKFDRAGLATTVDSKNKTADRKSAPNVPTGLATTVDSKHKMADRKSAPNVPNDADDKVMTRIATAEHTPRRSHTNKIIKPNTTSIFEGFVSAMDGY